MTTPPLISVALCTYNGEKFLTEQLDSLIAQTYENIEIIAVDDCSTDNTFGILTKYAAKHRNISIYRNDQNNGFLKNFEIALSYCNGDFIALCDQDDVWKPEKIDLQVAAIGENMVIYHDSEFIDDEGKLTGEKLSDSHNLYRGSDPKVFLFRNCVSGHAMLIRKDLLKHAFPFKNRFYHDCWLAYVAVNIGSIDFIPQCLVKYRRHPDSSTEKDVLTKSARILQEIKWLEVCASYSENKEAKFVKKLLKLYKNRTNSFTSIQLRNMLMKNVDLLFYIDNRSREAKLKHIKRFFWGIRAKNFWYTYISSNPEKVLHYK